MISRVPIFVPVDGSNKTGAVEYLHANFPQFVDANSIWPNGALPTVLIRRYNKAVLRWPYPWRDKIISFSAVVTPITNTDGCFPVVVDGSIVTYIQPGSGSLYPRRFDVTDLPIAPGGSRVEVWEPELGRDANLDQGIDTEVHGGYITGGWLPPGQTFERTQTSKCIVTVGDSVISSTNQPPEAFLTVVGQLRLLAQQNDCAVVSLDGGSYTLCGDGYTGAQLASLVRAAAATTGAATVYVYVQICANDKRYWSFPGSVQSPPATCRAHLQDMINALPTSYRKVVCTMMPTGPANEAANAGGFTMQDYRDELALVTGTNVTILDGTASGIIPAVDLYDGIHELCPPLGNGAPKNLAFMRASVGLP